MIEKEMAAAILEAIELKLSPLREKIEKFENLERVSHADLESLQKSLKVDLQNLYETLRTDLQAASCTDLKGFIDDTGKKFRVTAKLIESTMNALEQTTRAKKCEDDVKGLALLKGEENPIGTRGEKA